MLVVTVFSINAMSQKDSNSTRAFKDIYKTQETDRVLGREIKKKELQKTPSQIVLADTATKTKLIKKDSYRKKKKTN